MQDQSILGKAIRVLGYGDGSKDYGRLLRAIVDGEWTPEDARALKEYEQCLLSSKPN